MSSKKQRDQGQRVRKSKQPERVYFGVFDKTMTAREIAERLHALHAELFGPPAEKKKNRSKRDA